MTPTVPGLLLLCVDLQPIFLKAMADSATFQRRCAFAIQAAAVVGLEVIFTEHVATKLGHTAPELLQLIPQAVTFDKTTFSAFADDSIADAIRSRNVEHVLLCGLESTVCVYQTAIDLLSGGLQVTLLSDCLGARRPEDTTICIDALVRAGAHVLPSETIFYALLHNVAHPGFKAYTQLVKAHT